METGPERPDQLLGLLADNGLELVPIEGDGNCQFRALADQIRWVDVHHSICLIA